MKLLVPLVLLCSLLFFSCSHEDIASEALTKQNARVMQKSTRGIPQIIDYKKVNGQKLIKYTPKETKDLSCSVAEELFYLTYFDVNGDPHNLCYDQKELATALKRAGMPLGDAIDRAYKIFRTAYTSAELLGETAGFIGPNEVFSLHGNYVGRIFFFLNGDNCLEGCIPGPSPGPTPIPQNSCEDGEIRVVFLLRGTYGDVLLNEDNLSSIRVWSNCDPNVSWLVEFEFTDIISTLNQNQWTQLLLGELTERQVWNLFQHHLVPSLLQSHDEINLDDPCLYLKNVFFKANYTDNGEFGNTLVNIEGRSPLTCDTHVPLPD